MIEQEQIDLDAIDFSYPLTMIETTTYFEAYRPVLKALQLIDADDTFPLTQFLLKLTNEVIPPDYIKPETTFDFTPLIVDPNSDVKTSIIKSDVTIPQNARPFAPIQPVIERELRIRYHQSNRVNTKFKSVSVLDTDQWPTSDQLHLNPRQREALILALTHKVALIQGRKYYQHDMFSVN